LQQDDNGYKIIIERLIGNRKQRLRKIKKEEKNARKGSSIKKFSAANRVLPDLLDAVIESMEDDEELEKEALLNNPSASFAKKNNYKK